MALVRELFLGGNTPRGFHGFFDEVAADADYLYLIKGGAGVGKSSMMRKVGSRMSDEGYDIELFYCASAPRSLDGIYIRGARVAMLDATAPHTRDPRAPGFLDEIVCLGSNWDQKKLSARKDEALLLIDEKAALFARAGRYLAAYAPLHVEIGKLYAASTDRKKLKRLAELILFEAESYTQPEENARVRHFFASAIGCFGWYNRLGNLKSRAHRFILKAPITDYYADYLGAFADNLAANGVEAVACHDPLNPDRIVHVDLPNADASVMTSCPPHPIGERDGDVILDSAEVLLAHAMSKNIAAIEPAAEKSRELLTLCSEALRDGMQLHDDLEKIYADAMNFEKNDRLTEDIIARILAK